MLKNLFKDYVLPMAVFSGGMIGVGFLSLPYIATKVGIGLMFFYFVIITALILILNLIFCQLSLKTPDFKRFPGFVEYYLGKWPKIFSIISVALSGMGVLLVYLLVGGQFLASVFHGNILTYTLIYFLIASFIVCFDIKVIAKAEFWVMILLFISVIFVFVTSFSQIKIGNIFIHDSKFMIQDLFLPYGPLLFALWGIGLIPEIEEMVRKKKSSLKKIITTSVLIVSLFYILFTLLVVSITGAQTDQTALTGLKNFLGDGAASASLFVGALATFIAFITQALILKKTLMFDLKIKHWQAFIITCFTPMILLLLGLKSFIPILSFIGGVLLGINGILILLMYKKIGGKNIVIYPLSLVFLFGVVYEIIYFIK